MHPINRRPSAPHNTGGCCCSDPKPAAREQEAAPKLVAASDPRSRASGADKKAPSCCQSGSAGEEHPNDQGV